jgi:hypothetical protein
LMRPETRQRCRAIASLRRAVGLKIVDAEFSGFMRIPARFWIQGRHMALATFPFAIEDSFANWLRPP